MDGSAIPSTRSSLAPRATYSSGVLAQDQGTRRAGRRGHSAATTAWRARGGRWARDTASAGIVSDRHASPRVLAITAARLGTKVSGLDLSPELIEQARKTAAIARLLDIVWKQGDAEALP